MGGALLGDTARLGGRMNGSKCQGTALTFRPEQCEICGLRVAAVFMVVRQDVSTKQERVAKAHVCFTCFGWAQEKTEATTEAVSLQEFKEIKETRCLERLGDR